MCLLTYIHYHHQPPCTRPPSISAHYSYCPAAPLDPVTNSPSTPCLSTVLDPAHGMAFSTSTTSSSYAGGAANGSEHPCMSGNCLISPACSSGACRLQDLNGRWMCCKCRRGGNVYRWCHHRKKGCPDTFCYHEVCQGCTADEGGM